MLRMVAAVFLLLLIACVCVDGATTWYTNLVTAGLPQASNIAAAYSFNNASLIDDSGNGNNLIDDTMNPLNFSSSLQGDGLQLMLRGDATANRIHTPPGTGYKATTTGTTFAFRLRIPDDGINAVQTAVRNASGRAPLFYPTGYNASHAHWANGSYPMTWNTHEYGVGFGIPMDACSYYVDGKADMISYSSQYGMYTVFAMVYSASAGGVFQSQWYLDGKAGPVLTMCNTTAEQYSTFVDQGTSVYLATQPTKAAWPMVLDTMFIWNVALSSAEITTLVNLWPQNVSRVDTGIQGSGTVPIARYSFEGGSLANSVNGSRMGAFQPIAFQWSSACDLNAQISYPSAPSFITGGGPHGDVYASSTGTLLMTTGSFLSPNFTICYDFKVISGGWVNVPQVGAYDFTRPGCLGQSPTTFFFMTFADIAVTTNDGSLLANFGGMTQTANIYNVSAWNRMCFVFNQPNRCTVGITYYVNGVLKSPYGEWGPCYSGGYVGPFMHDMNIVLPPLNSTLLDEITVYPVAMTSSDVTADYNAFLATAAPTSAPMVAPTASPTTATPTNVPTSVAPTTATPTATPTTATPTMSPTTATPSSTPTTATLTVAPTTAVPTAAPSTTPTTAAPSVAPTTATPTGAPTTATPSVVPTALPSTGAPSVAPTTAAPTTAAPTTAAPTTAAPTTVAPTTAAPTTAAPTLAPTRTPTTTVAPTNTPTVGPTQLAGGTVTPTAFPNISVPFLQVNATSWTSVNLSIARSDGTVSSTVVLLKPSPNATTNATLVVAAQSKSDILNCTTGDPVLLAFRLLVQSGSLPYATVGASFSALPWRATARRLLSCVAGAWVVLGDACGAADTVSDTDISVPICNTSLSLSRRDSVLQDLHASTSWLQVSVVEAADATRTCPTGSFGCDCTSTSSTIDDWPTPFLIVLGGFLVSMSVLVLGVPVWPLVLSLSGHAIVLVAAFYFRPNNDRGTDVAEIAYAAIGAAASFAGCATWQIIGSDTAVDYAKFTGDPPVAPKSSLWKEWAMALAFCGLGVETLFIYINARVHNYGFVPPIICAAAAGLVILGLRERASTIFAFRGIMTCLSMLAFALLAWSLWDRSCGTTYTGPVAQYAL